MRNITITRKPVELKKTTRHGLGGEYSAKYWRQRYIQLKWVREKYDQNCDELGRWRERFEKQSIFVNRMKDENSELKIRVVEQNHLLRKLTNKMQPESKQATIHAVSCMNSDGVSFAEWVPQPESPRAIREGMQQ
jgi:hypothetical protein